MPVLAFIRKVDVTFCSGLVSNVQIDIIIVLWAAYGRLQTAVCRKKRSIEGLCDTEEREQAKPVHLFKNHQLKKHTWVENLHL